MAVREWKFDLPLKTDAELKIFLEVAFGVRLPDKQVCADHSTPFRAFSEAYFSRAPVSVWVGSRGFGGKTYTLAALGLTEAVTQCVDVNILGGSGEQSNRVHEHTQAFWNHQNAPVGMLAKDPTRRETALTNGAVIRALLASQTSVRGPHPVKLRCDEIDEMEIEILDAALGQPMDRHGIQAQTVLSSTHQYPDGTMTAILRRAAEKGWPVHKWCLPPNGIVIDGTGCPIEIQNVNKGDRVISSTGVSRDVTKTWERNFDGDLISIKVVGLPDPILVTPEHEVYNQSGAIKAQDLRPGMRLHEPVTKLSDGGDFLDGWVVGLYLAEGCFGGGGNGVIFATNESEAADVAAELQKWSDRNPTTAKYGPSTRGDAHVNRKGASAGRVVSVHNDNLVNLINRWVESEHGESGAGARTKRLKEMPVERAFVSGVLNGWLFGDGWSVERGMIGQTSSVDLGWQMFRLATSLGYATTLNRIKNRPGPSARNRGETAGNPAWRVKVSPFGMGVRIENEGKVLAARRMHKNDPSLSYREIGRRVGAKHTTVKSWITERNCHRLHPVVGQDCIYRLITEIETVPYQGPVHDLTVDVDHTFLAGGASASNCWRETLGPHGWLSADEVERKRQQVTEAMFRVEYDLQEPMPETRAIRPEAVVAMFDRTLGEYEGGDNEYIQIERVDPDGDYVTGADWARKQDRTVIITMRVDTDPMRIVAFERCQRLPWPVMVRKFNDRVVQFGGSAAHDATGLGDVVAGFLEVEAFPFIMAGRRRSNALSEYIAAIENSEIVAPYIRSMRNEHYYASVEDVYSTGHKYHLPDSMAAGALAHFCTGIEYWSRSPSE